MTRPGEFLFLPANRYLTAMKHRLFSIILLICCHAALSQDVTFRWVRTLGTSANDFGGRLILDNSQNVIMCGTFYDAMDVDPGPGVTMLTGGGGYILKYDPAGNLLWAKQITSNRGAYVVSVKLDASGNLYYTGTFSGVVDVDPGPGVFNFDAGNSAASFIAKLDPAGNFLWADRLDADISDIAIDAAGNVFAAGFFYNTVDFDPGPGTVTLTEYSNTWLGSGITDVFILKLNSAGSFTWVKRMGGTTSEECHTLNMDPAGNLYITGFFTGTADFDPGPATVNIVGSIGPDMFVSRLDNDGNLVWVKSIAGPGSERTYDAELDASQNIYFTGIYTNGTDFDPGPGTSTLSSLSQDAFVCKFDATGNFAWAKPLTRALTSSAYTYGRHISLDAARNIYVAGIYTGSCDFDNGPGVFTLPAYGSSDLYVEKMDNSGNSIWTKAFGNGDNADLPQGLVVDNDRNIYTSGHYWSYAWALVDFDPEAGVHQVGMVGTGDGFIHKMSECINVTYNTINANSCNTYSLNGHTYTASGTYTQTIDNVSGCDSVITLNLVIGGSTSTENRTACDSYTWEGQSYNNSGHYTVTLIGADGCDSIRHLDLVIRNKVLKSEDISICEGESYQGYTNTGTYVDTYVAANGCDSVRTLNLIVKQKALATVQATICEGESFLGYNSTGVYTNTFVAANGCDSIRTLRLQVNPRPVTNVSKSICMGENYFAGGASQTTAGIYKDTLQTWLGCDSIIITDLRVHALPRPSLGMDKNICAGSTLLLNPGNFISYNWQDGSNSQTFSAQTTGSYWVKVTDANNCSAADTMEVANINPIPTSFLKATDSICQYGQLALQPLRSFEQYTWSTGGSQPIASITTPGRYILKVKDANGCEGSDTTDVFLKKCLTGVYVPSGFTPNNDGKNDIFCPKVFGNVIHYRFEVYNRNGELVFRSTDPSKGWNGIFKGTLAPSAVFVWQCVYQLEGSPAGSQKGTVILLR